jgi:hypothetical protein
VKNGPWNTSILAENYYTSIIIHSENLPMHQRKKNGEPMKGKGIPLKKKNLHFHVHIRAIATLNLKST